MPRVRMGRLRPKDTTGRVAVGSRWTRFAPLAAAASVALLAVGLVRLIPREEYQAIPRRPDVAPSVAPPRAAPEAKAVSREGVSQTPRLTRARPQRRRSRRHVRRASCGAPRTGGRATGRAAAARAGGRRIPEHDGAAVIARSAFAFHALGSTTIGSDNSTGNRALQRACPQSPRPRMSKRPPSSPNRLRLECAKTRHNGPASTPRRFASLASNRSPGSTDRLAAKRSRSPAPEQRVPGYVVTVDASGTILRYHTDERDQVRICKDE